MRKIIHVDNSVFFRKQVKIFLESEGFKVESFGTAQEATIAIVGGLPDMIIMGLAFSDAEGEEFLARAVESFDGPIIVLSSTSDERKAEKLISLGAHALVNKSASWKDELKPYLYDLDHGN